MNEYGVRWQEFNRQDRVVGRERFFETEKALNRFVARLEQKASFYRFVAWIYPEKVEEVK